MHLRNVTSLGAIYALTSSWSHVLAGLPVLALVCVMAAIFLRWLVALSPARRAAVLRLIEILRRR
jgi:hypothetical protein